jgi:hypothetical protein
MFTTLHTVKYYSIFFLLQLLISDPLVHLSVGPLLLQL